MKKRLHKKLRNEVTDSVVYKVDKTYNIIGWNRLGWVTRRPLDPDFESLNELGLYYKINRARFVEVTKEQEEQLWENGGTSVYGSFFVKYFQDRAENDYKQIEVRNGKVFVSK